MVEERPGAGNAPGFKDNGVVKPKGRSRLPVLDGQAPVDIAARKPAWLRVRSPGGPNYLRLKQLMRGGRLHSVCEEAGCPNIGECWEAGTAAFLILGDVCTRACKYCAVAHGLPAGLDEDEPRRVAEAVARLGLQHAVLTSVTRDDLPDGGARVFAETVRLCRELRPGCTVELLIPDFKGDETALASVVAARPDILNHNLETVERLYPAVRAGARYWRGIALLAAAKRLDPGLLTKSGLLVGLGETVEELERSMVDLRAAGVDILTLGQYLRPSAAHAPIARWVEPAEFDRLKRFGEDELGFQHVEAGPLVRSSYHAEQQARVVRTGANGENTGAPEADRGGTPAQAEARAAVSRPARLSVPARSGE